ncbi:MAG: hypothetical protein V7L05_20415, partial [Nostoc sp.]
KGDTGNQGDKGDTGNQGDKGDAGNQGDKGDKGDDGVSSEDEVEIVKIPVKVFKNCIEEKPQFELIEIGAIKGTENEIILQFNQLANIEGLQCKKIESIAGVPEWWQIRPEGHRPQVILQFGELLQNDKVGPPGYPITVPHPQAESRWLQSPIVSYIKGNCEGILTLSDNSKLIVNCRDKEECLRVISALKPWIVPSYLSGATSKIGDRNGQPIEIREMRPKQAKYFSQGLRSLNPDWVAYF